MYNTVTNTMTYTYTVTDIRKTFEGFSADFRMIATRTGKMSFDEVEKILHDVMVWAENKYLKFVDITLINSINLPLKATRYSVDENGKALQSERAGNNDWQNLPNTELIIIVQLNSAWNTLTSDEQLKWKISKNLKKSWGNSNVDNSYSHLSKQNAQLYASNGYELKKENFK